MKSSSRLESAQYGCLVALAFLMLGPVGCNYLPPTPIKQATPSDAWVDDGRRCDWVCNQNVFLVPNLLDLPFLAAVDKSQFTANLASASSRKLPLGKSISMPRPKGLDDNSYEMLRRFTEPFQVAKQLAEFPTQGKVRAVRFSPGGRYLLIVADSIELWDVKNKQRLKSYPCEMPNLEDAYLHASGKSCYLASIDEIHRIDLSSGIMKGRFRQRTGTIAGTDFAENASQMIVISSEGGALLLDASLQILDRYPEVHSTSRVSIDTDATQFFVAGAGSGMHRHRIDHVDTGANPPILPATDDDHISFEGERAFLYHREVLNAQRATRSGNVPLRIKGVIGLQAQNNGQDSWVACLRHLEIGDQSSTVIQDFLPEFGLGSAPTVLPGEKPSAFDFCNLGDVIALGYEGKVTIFRRRRWAYANHYDFAFVLADFAVSENRFDQWESIVNSLASLEQTYDGVVGEELELEFIRRLAMRIESNPNSPRHVSQWLNSGTPLATSTAAYRACALRALAYESESIQDATRRLDELEKTRPNTLSLLFTKFILEQRLYGDRRPYSHLAELITHYPTFVTPHLYMSEMYSSQFSENQQANESYLLQVGELYPPNLRESMLAQISLADMQTKRTPSVGFTNIPASLAPALRHMIASEYFTEVQLQHIYRFAINNAQSELQEAFWSYDAPIAAAKATGHSL